MKLDKRWKDNMSAVGKPVVDMMKIQWTNKMPDRSQTIGVYKSDFIDSNKLLVIGDTAVFIVSYKWKRQFATLLANGEKIRGVDFK